MDIVIRNARLRGRSATADIGVLNGKIAAIGRGSELTGKETIDAKANLSVPSFVDPHMHLDKAFLGHWGSDASGTYVGEIDKLKELKKQFTVSDVCARAERAVELAVSNGITFIRTNVDVDTSCGLTGLKGVLEAKRKCADIATIQVAAFPSQGLIADEGAEELLWQAMKTGADVVAGIPRLEADDDDSKKHTDIVFEIAKNFSVDLDMHIDAICDSESRTIHYLAAKTIREKYQGRVTAGHLVALSYYNDYYAERIINLIKKAGIHVVTCPATTMMSGARLDKEPRGRGVTRIRQLIESGVNIALAQDNIRDVYNPFGDADPLTNAFLTAYAGQLSSDSELETLMDMVTGNGAKILRLSDYGIQLGMTASFNVIGASNLRDAFGNRADRMYVIRKGRIIATARTERRVNRGAS